MNLRFLKKQDGTKVLQYKDIISSEYTDVQYIDVPVVEETSQATDMLMKAFFVYKDHENDDFIILINPNFSEKLIEEYKNKHNLNKLDFFCGHKVYVTKMNSNFKFVKEL